jgi:hypothetical protein
MLVNNHTHHAMPSVRGRVMSIPDGVAAASGAKGQGEDDSAEGVGR